MAQDVFLPFYLNIGYSEEQNFSFSIGYTIYFVSVSSTLTTHFVMVFTCAVDGSRAERGICRLFFFLFISILVTGKSRIFLSALVTHFILFY